jgi:serpin B
MRPFLSRLTVLLAMALLTIGCTTTVTGPNAPVADKAEAAKGNNKFAMDLYHKLAGEKGNLFFSPASISTALAMTYAGARGETASQMAKTLHFTLDEPKLHPALGALLFDLNAQNKDQGNKLSMANALWAQKGHPFEPEFVKLNKDNYGAGLNEVDFREAAEQARETINAWVAKQTQDRIKDLLSEGVLTPQTRLVLTNAIYFKGIWANKFTKEATREAPFHFSAMEKVNVPLMTQTDKFNYLDGKSFQALQLPYKGKNLSMVVLLPQKVDGLAELEKSLTAEQLTTWLGKLHEREVIVSLPRFQLTSEFSLKETLSKLGMPLAFSPEANFSGIDGQKDLYLSAVVHKAFVDVNEEGTEAAAATGAVARTLSVQVDPTPIFKADHPFLFLIRDERTGSILFLGRVINPSK